MFPHETVLCFKINFKLAERKISNALELLFFFFLLFSRVNQGTNFYSINELKLKFCFWENVYYSRGSVYKKRHVSWGGWVFFEKIAVYFFLEIWKKHIFSNFKFSRNRTKISNNFIVTKFWEKKFIYSKCFRRMYSNMKMLSFQGFSGIFYFSRGCVYCWIVFCSI